jgi:deoxyribodipyrimidine photo-lyase
MINVRVFYDDILAKIISIDPITYGKTRNFSDGAVTHLSPYISRGVISTKQVMEHVLALELQPYQSHKLLQELAWRDYWQQIWIEKGDEINKDLKREQPEVENHQIQVAILEGNTGITAIDQSIEAFYQSGYMHNHMRMYIAALACNTSKSHWLLPAQWMYYHLLDGDWASNALSWQWVAGSNSSKKYIANQENINKYFYTEQQYTILDVPYDELPAMKIPTVLQTLDLPDLKTALPTAAPLDIDNTLPTCVYNNYNLDPNWRKNIPANRILLLEPSHFKQYPISNKVLDFILALSGNIEEIQVFVGEFDELNTVLGSSAISYKEHPTANHYVGTQDDRDWMFSVKGYYPSFFNFWKRCKKELPAP